MNVSYDFVEVYNTSVSTINRTRGITNLGSLLSTIPTNCIYLSYVGIGTREDDNLLDHGDEPPGQNHGHGRHHWLDAMVPPLRIVSMGGGRGRFGSV